MGSYKRSYKSPNIWVINIVILLITPLITTWTPKVCRIIAFCRFWAIVLPTVGGLGKHEPPSRTHWDGLSPGSSSSGWSTQ